MSIPGIEQTVGATLEKAAARYPEKVAIQFEFNDLSLSFRELNEKANQFANSLGSVGIHRGDHIAVMLPNCPEFPFTWLALAKLGAVMVPVNMRYEAHDLEYILNDSDATGLVIHTDGIPLFRKVQPRCPGIKIILRVGDGEEEIGQSLVELARHAPTGFESIPLALDDLMNIQYTSGSTGFPKGCMLTHESWLTLGWPVARGVTEGDIFMSVQPFYYMDPQWQLIMTLMVGSTMVLTKKYSPSKFIELARKYRATCTLAPAATLIFKQPESPFDRNHCLRFVLIYGFPPSLHKKFEERFNVIAREGYGMTEIAGGMRVPMEDSFMTGSGSVGKPRPYVDVKIVDEKGNDVPQGDVGELLLRGPGIFKGYYKKPAETAERFTGDWFHTGDLFRKDEKGYYYIVGRKKDMVRRTAENISSAEVEMVLKSHPKVLDAAVVPVPDDIRYEEVKAYIVPNPGENPQTLPPEELVAFCMERIAKFKVPRFIEYRNEFPRTATLKVEKYKLRAEKKNLRSGCYDAQEKRWIE